MPLTAETKDDSVWGKKLLKLRKGSQCYYYLLIQERTDRTDIPDYCSQGIKE